MGTTRIKVIDLSSDKKQIKTSRKHAEKLVGVAKLKETRETKVTGETKGEHPGASQPSEPSKPSRPSQPSLPSQPPPSPATVTKKKTSSDKSSSRHKGHKYLEASTLVDKEKKYDAAQALELLNKVSFTKFDPTVEAHFNVTEKNIKGAVNLPHPFAAKKEKKYLIFSDQQSTVSDKQILWGDEKTIADIENGKLKPSRDFDAVFASPKFMPLIAKIAKVLGPAGLMPNPKNGTITDEPQKSIAKGQEGNYEYKTDPTASTIHTKLGKLSDKPEELSENLKAIITSIGPTKINKAVVKSTMSPSIQIDLTAFAKQSLK